jgi:hypothetical protein
MRARRAEREVMNFIAWWVGFEVERCYGKLAIEYRIKKKPSKKRPRGFFHFECFFIPMRKGEPLPRLQILGAH